MFGSIWPGVPTKSSLESATRAIARVQRRGLQNEKGLLCRGSGEAAGT